MLPNVKQNNGNVQNAMPCKTDFMIFDFMILLFLNYFREKMENKIGILTQIAEKN
jgi:hypothetical protein